jgi:hypothetical protein
MHGVASSEQMFAMLEKYLRMFFLYKLIHEGSVGELYMQASPINK